MLSCNNNNHFNTIIPVARVVSFYFNLLSPFLLIVSVPSSQATSFRILLYALFPWFPWSTLFSFHSYFKLHNLTHLGVDVSTDDHPTTDSFALSHLWSSQQQPFYPEEHQSTPYRPVSPQTSTRHSTQAISLHPQRHIR